MAEGTHLTLQNSLPEAIKACMAGVQVGYFHGYIDGVDWVFIDHPCFHGREHDIYGGSRQDIQFRCALLCKAAIEAPWHVPCGGSVYGDENLVYLANDWHTGLLPVYLQVLLQLLPCFLSRQSLL